MTKYKFHGVDVEFTDPTITIGPIIDVRQGTTLVHVNIQISVPGITPINHVLGSMNYTSIETKEVEIAAYIEGALEACIVEQ